MKHTKRLLAILIAALILAVSAAPALAAAPYTLTSLPETVNGEGLGLKEKLQVEKANMQNPEVTYTLTLGNITAFEDSGVTYGDAEDGVQGADDVNGKDLATVSFAKGAVKGTNSLTKNYIVNDTTMAAIKALKFDRPGIYYWTINKSSSSTEGNLTNHNRNQGGTGTALVIRVDDQDGALVPTVNIVVTERVGGKPTGNKETTYEDNYPADPGTLLLKKEVVGNQGAKDKYFKFEVEISGMTGFGGSKITVAESSSNTVATATFKYDENPGTGFTNIRDITVAEDGTATAIFWLKDQESINLTGIPGIDAAGTVKYTIKEVIDDNEGYTTSYSINETGTYTIGKETSQQSLTLSQAARVVFKNDKGTNVPTGITLQMAAPLFGIVLAGLLMAVVLFSKRRENY